MMNPAPFNRSVQGTLAALIFCLVLASCRGENRPADASAREPAGSPSAAAPVEDREGESRPAPATAWVIFGTDTVTAQVAQSSEERSQGLMYRESLPEDAGMLFIFPEETVRSFWMQNTYIPLDIAFMDREFRIVDIQQMDPMTTESHVSRAPATYALEVNQGWFAAHGVRVGDRPRVVFGG